MGLERRAESPDSKNTATASEGSQGRRQQINESMRSRLGRGANVKSEQGEGDISGYEDAIKAAEESDDPDAYKYKLAVEIVDSQIGNEQTLGDDEYRQAIDATFDQMNPTVSGSEMRDEANDPLSGAVRGARGVIDDINQGVGTGLDWLWDNTVGNLAGLVGGGVSALFGGDFEDSFEDVKGNVSDWVTPETGAMVSDMVMDLGLAAIPGVGIPLSVAKNAIQNSENIWEGVTGIDDITGERIDPGQQVAKLATGLGGTALSAIPGIGKMRNANNIADDAAKALGKYDDLLEGSDDMLRALDSGDVDSVVNAAAKSDSPLMKAIGGDASKFRTEMNASQLPLNRAGARLEAPAPFDAGKSAEGVNAVRNLRNQAAVASRANTPRAAIDEIVSTAKGYPGNFRYGMGQAGSSLKSAAGNLAHGHPIKAARGARQAIRNVGDAIIPTRTPLNMQTSLAGGAAKPTAAQRIGTLGTGFVNSPLPRLGIGIGSGLLANYAENGDRALEALANGVDNPSAAFALPLAAMAFSPGIRRMSTWLPNPSGQYGSVSIPRMAVTGTSAINHYSSHPFATDEGEVAGDEAAEYIRKAGGR